MANKWLAHVKKTMKSHKGLKFGQVLKLAKKSYKKRGGASDGSASDTPAPAAAAAAAPKPEAPAAAMGGRKHKRGTRRTRRLRK